MEGRKEQHALYVTCSMSPAAPEAHTESLQLLKNAIHGVPVLLGTLEDQHDTVKARGENHLIFGDIL